MGRMPSPGRWVTADLLEAATIEGLWGLGERDLGPPPPGLPSAAPCPGSGWVRVDLPGGGWLAWSATDGAPVTRTRHAGGPVWYREDAEHHTAYPVGPDRVLALLEGARPHRDAVLADLRTAVRHAHVVRAGWLRLPDPALRPADRDGGPAATLLAGERLAATRGRPFHPTARAVGGWTGEELARFGPMTTEPVPLDWVGVRRDHLRLGPGTHADRLAELVLGEPAASRLTGTLPDPDGFVALPVHPFDGEHVLPKEFGDEIRDGIVVPLGRAGEAGPTASLRTLALPGRTPRHLKLPLAVTTLGAARLLPPRHLDHGDRATRVISAVLGSDPGLAARVGVADESDWAGFARPDGSDEFDDRPGRLAAQLRHYPDLGDCPLPLAALAAPGWDLLGPLLGVDDRAAAERFLAALTTDVLTAGIGFLGHGVLPEMHGQNVVVAFDRDPDRPARVRQLVLRDHDTLRVHPDWARAAGTPDPGYRIAPGASQSLVLDRPERLVGYLQTLVVQVALRGVAVAMGEEFGIPEPAWWDMVRDAVPAALDAADPPAGIRDALTALLLDAPVWPARAVLGPLLDRGPSEGVSMPAGVVEVPNPLRGRAR
ncbi:siderophore staphylobactin biosynthesis protein SbnC [Pseudonocardia sp. C8]|uniref:IucA/IucC family protein n=1 Tax=Pseudonocardia sp. C8 TaxID=2762759 RepID=UPI001642C568|nr:IucA/IucC family protein [Pseudonocardia sp. C8]MBC3191055.1 siderophore staphylobactin biosynthesis protein SbnC [Pseudonocardia sp. C8]